MTAGPLCRPAAPCPLTDNATPVSPQSAMPAVVTTVLGFLATGTRILNQDAVPGALRRRRPVTRQARVRDGGRLGWRAGSRLAAGERAMARYLVIASYTAEGLSGLQAKGGSARVEAAGKFVASAGGSVESFYFALGADDVYIVCHLPDNVTAAAILNVGGGDWHGGQPDGHAADCREDGPRGRTQADLPAAGLVGPCRDWQARSRTRRTALRWSGVRARDEPVQSSRAERGRGVGSLDSAARLHAERPGGDALPAVFASVAAATAVSRLPACRAGSRRLR